MVALSRASQALLSTSKVSPGKLCSKELGFQESVSSFNIRLAPQTSERLQVNHTVQRPCSWTLYTAASCLTLCTAALQARCSTEQQTIQNQSAVANKAPLQARQKENLPKLDDGGTGGGPGRGDRGGGGGGGGGGGWAGGFFFWGLLMMIGFIRDNEKDKPYRQSPQTKKQARRRHRAQME